MLRASILILALAALLLFAAPTRHAQTGQDASVPNGNAPQRPGEFGSPTEEMLRRAEIRGEEESHKEMVERSDEAAQLGREVLSSYKKNNSLTAEDYKKLERLEKLARKIRGGAGGSDDEESKELPGQTDAALARLADLSDELKKSVAKTSRFVISAAVIKNSNEIIELIHHIRGTRRQ